MKHLKIGDKKRFVFLCIAFLSFFLSYTGNIFHVVPENIFHFFERQPEGLVIGRLVRAQQDGVFSRAGLTGVNYYSDEGNIKKSAFYAKTQAGQHDIYMLNKAVPVDFYAYKSQTGGQGIVFSTIQLVLPFSNATKLMIFRAISAFFSALVFVFILSWSYKRFGFLSACVTFILLLCSPYLTMYAHNLWWVMWSFFIPFVTVLYVLDKKREFPEKYSDKKLCIYAFGAIFLKCFFTGFEFISTTLVAGICPIIYYIIVEQKKIKDLAVLGVKVGISMLAGVLAEMLILIVQLRFYEGTFAKAVDYIVSSFFKRSAFTETPMSYSEILNYYLGIGAFDLPLLKGLGISVSFGLILILTCLLGVFICWLGKNKVITNHKENISLVVFMLFSLLAPLSWFIIFKEHAAVHLHLDAFVWYLPTLPLCFIIIGKGISLFILSIKKRILK